MGLADPGSEVVVTPESFTLIDAAGKECPLASFKAPVEVRFEVPRVPTGQAS